MVMSILMIMIPTMHRLLGGLQLCFDVSITIETVCLLHDVLSCPAAWFIVWSLCMCVGVSVCPSVFVCL